MDFRVLGTLEVWDDGRQLALSRPKERALLSVLLLNANTTLSIDRLTDELWPANPPAKPAEAVQELVYQLRRIIEEGRPRGSLLERQGDGYRMLVGAEELDRSRFERLMRAAGESRSRGELDAASWTLREALALWRGDPLANVTPEPGTLLSAEVERLRELKLAARLACIELDIQRGLEGEAIGELESVVAEHRLNERAHALLMLSLYREGRQADALAVYQRVWSALTDDLGIEPGQHLGRLQQQILRHDPALDRPAPSDATTPVVHGLADLRTVVVCGTDTSEVDALLAIATPLGRSQLSHELLAALLISPGEIDLETASRFVQERRAQVLALGVAVRATAFASASPADDMARLAAREDVDLLLVACAELTAGPPPAAVAAVLETVPCDVGVVTPRQVQEGAPVVVPFGGSENDWAALEVGAWMASALECELVLVGSRGSATDRRDASRLLADATLAVQQFAHVSTLARVVEPGVGAFLAQAEDAALLVAGLPDRWRTHGVGDLRATLADQASVPVMLVRKGVRPSGLAPREAGTMFAWSVLQPGAPASEQL